MDFNNSWAALHRPGRADNFFCEGTMPSFNGRRRSFDPVNCYWLAELCRLVYNDETRYDTTYSRQAILNKVNLRQTFWIDCGGMQAAVIKGQGDVDDFALLIFRGSSELGNWWTNFQFMPHEFSGGGRVHGGFSKAFYCIWTKIRPHLPEEKTLFYAGHSLGGVMALLASLEKTPAAVYTFGAPRSGCIKFVSRLRHIPVFRVVNNCDIVTELPLGQWPLRYHHAGLLAYIQHDSKVAIAPSPQWVHEDRKKTPLLRRPGGRKNLLPQCFADHAPVNYSAHLVRNINHVSKYRADYHLEYS